MTNERLGRYRWCESPASFLKLSVEGDCKDKIAIEDSKLEWESMWAEIPWPDWYSLIDS